MIRTTQTRFLVAAALAGTTLFAATACGTAAGAGGDGSTRLAIVGFAVPEAANKAIAEKFDDTTAGKDVEFRTSYGASGDLSRAVEGGLEPDYLHFSVGTDVDRLVEAGLIDETWDDGPNRGQRVWVAPTHGACAVPAMQPVPEMEATA